MKFSKQIIDDIFKCYSVNALDIEGETTLLFGGEGPGICQMYSGPGFRKKHLLWEGGGGIMSLVTVPDYSGYFFASRGFYSMVEAERSGIYLLRYHHGSFDQQKILEIPHLHRFDVLLVEDRRYFIGAALHSGKKNKEDWSNPGKVFIGELPMDLDGEIEVGLKPLMENLTKNHGFNRGIWKGRESVFIASEEGVFAITPPGGLYKEWSVEQIFSHPVSDVAVMDLDGDGEPEFAILSPFHGSHFDVFKKVDGKYLSVFQYEKQLDFYHAIYADTFNGVPTFVIGARKEDMDLFMVQYDHKNKRFIHHLIDTGAGSSNARIIHTAQGDLIMSANRQIDQAVVYRWSPD